MANDSTEAERLLCSESYARVRVSPVDPSTLRCEAVEQTLLRLADASSGRLTVEKFAESYQGRPIYLATVGCGPRRVLLWSQMHGDEPTHTAVLLDLLSYLTHSANESAAAAILAGCTIYAIPMLNPDGAAAVTRFNAQHIDINRDSQRLETLEGRALDRAVASLRPEFAFNLHNQNAPTAYGNPPKPAAVALMAPPIDVNHTETAQIRAAKQVAACFATTVEPLAKGMIGQYVAEYMPWAFGEAIQARGVVTVLVEAGGWPGADPSPLIGVHFAGLVVALKAIADDSYRNDDTRVFDQLPRDNELKLFDATIQGALVLDVDCVQPLRADLGINHSHGHRLALAHRPDGKIVDIGDLGTSTGKTVIAAAECLVLPGSVAFLNDWRPGTRLDAERIDLLLARGVTLAVGCADVVDRNFLEALTSPLELPLNWTFVARADRTQPAATGRTSAELAEEIWNSYQSLGLGVDRGKIRREFFADLALYEKYDVGSRDGMPGAVRRVIVAGETVWADGKRTGKNAGTLLWPNAENRAC